MTTPYFPPPPTSSSTIPESKRKRISFPALPSPSEAFAPLFKSRLALQKKIASNRFSSSSSSSTVSSSTSSPLSPTSWTFDTQRHPKTKKDSISRPIISPTRAKPPANALTMSSGQVVAVGLPCSPRVSRTRITERPQAIAEEDLGVYSPFDPRPLPGPPPRSLPRSPKPPSRLLPIDAEIQMENRPEAYYDVGFELDRQMARMSDAQPSGPAASRRRQPPRPLALTASKESQWEVMSAPPVMVPRFNREEVEVPVHLEGMQMDMPAVGMWETIGARRAREL